LPGKHVLELGRWAVAKYRNAWITDSFPASNHKLVYFRIDVNVYRKSTGTGPAKM
jgi:hypothetical protein